MSEKTLSYLFAEEPWQWGLRGDPYLWKEMAILLGEIPLPKNEAQLLNLLERYPLKNPWEPIKSATKRSQGD